ncbi:hypothetical protein CVV65_05845 [Kyrpidia spormannii]|uniref:Uncharacterized protein n=1 Tax=Kyrpidia spormannii TaxID=2055160 RepID=A0A2K8N5B6_9BACL|nr:MULTISPECIES: hypothetical protein [Kyrpidia]ATY84534.1 hypothetical protein CVV65_05845 [Kyrpidia spormannii]MCL6577068.1 hypothetical protein [Kyrpidia sp.]
MRKLTSVFLWILLTLGALGGVGTVARMLAPAQADTAGPRMTTRCRRSPSTGQGLADPAQRGVGRRAKGGRCRPLAGV